MQSQFIRPFTFLATLLAASGVTSAKSAFAAFPGTNSYIPAAARAGGALGSQFYTTLWVTNPGSASTSYSVRFYPRDQTGGGGVFTGALAPGATRRIDNVIQTLFGFDNAAGALQVTSSTDVLISSRTYNLPIGTSVADSTGLFFGGIPVSFAIQSGETTVLQGVSQGGAEDSRYNFGIVEVAGAPATIRVALRDGTGAMLALKDYTVRALEPKQYSVSDLLPAISTANAVISATVIEGSGRVLLYGGRVPGAVEFRVKRGGSLPADNGRCVTARGCTGEGAADAEKNREEGGDASPGCSRAAAAAAGAGGRSLESVAA